jgi:AraC family transcriptional regulator
LRHPACAFGNAGPPRHLVVVHLGGRACGERSAANGQSGLNLPETISIVPANTPADLGTTAGDAVYLSLAPEVVSRTARRGGLSEPSSVRLLARRAVHDPVIWRIGLDLLQEVEHPGWGGPVAIASLTDLLATHLLRRHSTASSATLPIGDRGTRLLPAVVARIDADLAGDLSVPVLAAVGISPDHFARLFRRASGVTPHDFIVRRRVERARDLLRAGGRSIAEVAHDVGFADQSHLTRHFGRLLGTTPARFLREHGILQRPRSFLQDLPRGAA